MKKMKNLLLAILTATCSLSAFGQDEETRSLSSFDEISVHEGIKVYMKKGSKEEARVVSENVDLEDVLTEVSGSRLKVHLDGSRWKRVDVEVYVTYRELSAISASSAGRVKVEDVIDASGSDFEIDVSSAGSVKAEVKNIDDLDLDASSSGNASLVIEANQVSADVSSSGELNISGKVDSQRVQVSSAGIYRAEDLESKEADVEASSAGSIRINVSDRLDASASSGGSVRYDGSPEYLDANFSSGGSVRKS